MKTISVTDKQWTELVRLQHCILHQDVRGTSHPLYCVYMDFPKLKKLKAVCLTDSGAHEFIRREAHNLLKPHVYVHSACDNPELRFLQALLGTINLTDSASPQSPPDGLWPALSAVNPVLELAAELREEAAINQICGSEEWTELLNRAADRITHTAHIP